MLIHKTVIAPSIEKIDETVTKELAHIDVVSFKNIHYIPLQGSSGIATAQPQIAFMCLMIIEVSSCINEDNNVLDFKKE